MDIKIETLSTNNVNEYIQYLEKAMFVDPNMMTTNVVDRNKVIENLSTDSISTSLIAFCENKVVGRIEYHFYNCIQDSYKMAYVNWIYVLPEYRHMGIAQELFNEFEKICKEYNVDEYYLIMAENTDAQKFYSSFKDANIKKNDILRKYIVGSV